MTFPAQFISSVVFSNVNLPRLSTQLNGYHRCLHFERNSDISQGHRSWKFGCGRRSTCEAFCSPSKSVNESFSGRSWRSLRPSPHPPPQTFWTSDFEILIHQLSNKYWLRWHYYGIEFHLFPMSILENKLSDRDSSKITININ